MMERQKNKKVKMPKPPKIPKIKLPTKAMLRELARREREKVKKWREKDKKMLFEAVKERYLQYRKMRVNVVRIDPYKKIRR